MGGHWGQRGLRGHWGQTGLKSGIQDSKDKTDFLLNSYKSFKRGLRWLIDY
ncbi:MAG: hypothetical protein LBB88_06370 [Planctomycetaceae bacterium]|nr:hypothetical protein [Planctomycetaceae bacterium]